MDKHVILLVAVIQLASGLLLYQDRIPNGFRVPHPCFEAQVWMGVGHQQREGGGALNPFGQDFRENGFEWDWCLCQHDSDGDGKTNGEELGDPDCEWVIGEIPKSVSGLSHPGICEPINDPKCAGKNDFIKDICTVTEFDCDAINEPESRQFLAAFTEVEVAPVETSYWCYAMEVPHNETYHLFAMEPAITNPKVVHHIEVYDCPDHLADDVLDEYPVPKACGAMGGCGGLMLAQWSLGIGPVCLKDSHGAKMTNRVAMVRIHYHNPEELVGEKDSSGLLLHYTNKIRTYDTQMMSHAGMYLEIPPGLPSIKQDVVCSPNCMGGPNGLQENIYIIMATTHMHFLGKSSRTELWRNGSFVQVIFEQENYDYNAPLFISHEENPIEVRPTDTIKHTCEFQSMDRTEMTYRGQSGNDEMCATVFVYYPAHTFLGCQNYGQVERCNYMDKNTVEFVPDSCDYADFQTQYNAWMKGMLEMHCDTDGLECRDYCAEAVHNVTQSHGCFQNETLQYVKKRNEKLRNMMHSCKVWPTAPPPATAPPPVGDCKFYNAANGVVPANLVVLPLIAMAMLIEL